MLITSFRGPSIEAADSIPLFDVAALASSELHCVQFDRFALHFFFDVFLLLLL